MRSLKPGRGIAQSAFIVKLQILMGDISGERVTIHPGPDAEKDIGIGDGREGNHFAALNHRGEIHKILHRLQVEFFDFGDLGRQEPTPLIVVAELCGDFDCYVSGRAAILLYLFHASRPQIGI